MTPVDLEIRMRIGRRGPIPFAEVVEAALYAEPGGFYASGGRAGRRGDFITSPEVGPLFGAVVAGALDRWWRASGSPAVFVVVEVGAGPGTLARAVLQAGPACAASLRYVLVESSAAQRATQRERLPLDDPAMAFASLPQPEDDGIGGAVPGGPIVVSLAALPRLPGPCVVVANELLDNLPFGLAERTAVGWAEVFVGADGDRLVEVLSPLDPAEGRHLDDLTPGLPPGARVPLPRAGAAWVADARALAGPDGRVVAFDYGRPTAQLAAVPWLDWVRTYRHHERGGPPLAELGTQDVTCEVAVDQLGTTPTSDRSQADWLRAHGIEELVEEGRRTWLERAAIGDLAAVRARSRVTEAEALLDPAGLGAFRVLEWPAGQP